MRNLCIGLAFFGIWATFAPTKAIILKLLHNNGIMQNLTVPNHQIMYGTIKAIIYRHFLQHRFWEFRIIVFSLLVAFISFSTNIANIRVLYSNIFYMLRENEWLFYWQALAYKANHLSADLHVAFNADEWDHYNKMNYRLTVPLIMKVLFLKNPRILFLFYVVIGLLNNYLFIKILQQNTFLNKNKELLFLLVLAFANTYVGAAFFLDGFGWGDTIAFALILLSLYSINVFVFGVCLLLAYFTDERVLINLGWIYFWVIFRENNFRLELSLKDLFLSKNKYTLMLFFTCIVYIVIRIGMKHYYEIPEYYSGILTKLILERHTFAFGMDLIGFVEGFLLAIILLLVVAYRSGQFIIFSLLLVQLSITTIASLLVFDAVRSFSYGFTAYILALFVLSNYLSSTEQKVLICMITVISVLFPIYLP